MKLTASKMSIAALATSNRGSTREGRGDVGTGTRNLNGTDSCKGGKDESSGNFELHTAFVKFETETEE